MSLKRIEARDLPALSLDAASAFHTLILPQIRGASASGDASGDNCVVLFDPADHSHESWRKAAIGELAREAAPCRLNGVIGSSQSAIDEICDYLANAQGVTGQIFETDSNSVTNS